MTAQAMARQCADAMMAHDTTIAFLGATLDRVEPGRAEVSMVVKPFMLNGYGMCHGGFMFTLADVAFAYACNTYDQVTVAQHCSITFLASARAGMKLKAVATERQRANRSGIYDVVVVDDHGATLAEFRGLSRTIKGKILSTEESTRG